MTPDTPCVHSHGVAEKTMCHEIPGWQAFSKARISILCPLFSARGIAFVQKRETAVEHNLLRVRVNCRRIFAGHSIRNPAASPHQQLLRIYKSRISLIYGNLASAYPVTGLSK